MEKVTNYTDLPIEVRIDQIAEEAAEMAAAAAKYARKLRGENPTPKSLIDCRRALIEEFTDCYTACKSAEIKVDYGIMRKKLQRWKDRLTGSETESQSTEKTIKIKFLREIDPIIQFNQGDWIDLRCAEDISLKKGESALIPLGIAVELPKGYEAVLAARSSTFWKYGIILTNAIGIIDESYCGDADEWKLPVLATRDTSITKNSRIAQFRIIEHQPDIGFKVVETLGNADRGGFGSTGSK